MLEAVAYAGEPGAFGELACIARFPDRPHIAMPSFAEAARAVAEGYAGHAMIPLRNSRAGAVPGVAELLADARLLVAGHHALPVAMHCLGLPDATLAGLREVHSHPVALRQCARFIARTGLRMVAANDTATAARHVAARGDPALAALGSARAAELYGLRILATEVQDARDNVTTFAVIERALPGRLP